MSVEGLASGFAVVHPAIKIGVGAGLLLAAGGTPALLLVRTSLRRAGYLGRQASKTAPQVGVPLTSFTRHGRPGDPLSVRLVATADQIGAAFVEAGWYRADELDFVTSARICVDSVLARR